MATQIKNMFGLSFSKVLLTIFLTALLFLPTGQPAIDQIILGAPLGYIFSPLRAALTISVIITGIITNLIGLEEIPFLLFLFISIIYSYIISSIITALYGVMFNKKNTLSE